MHVSPKSQIEASYTTKSYKENKEIKENPAARKNPFMSLHLAHHSIRKKSRLKYMRMINANELEEEIGKESMGSPMNPKQIILPLLKRLTMQTTIDYWSL